MSIKTLLQKLKLKAKPLYKSTWIDETQSFYGIDNSVVTASSFESFTTTGNGYVVGQFGDSLKKKERVKKKPVDIYKEILKEEPKFTIATIDEQIELVKRRIRVLKDELGMNLSDEPEALRYLESRKILQKRPHLFNWQCTTDKLVNDLCEKYTVRRVDAQSYYKTMPMEAIEELEKYLEEYKHYSKTKPVLRLIIDDEDPAYDEIGKMNERKKDPILLASSPFGKWWFVLGAWDKEVEIIDDLIYHNK